MKEKNIVDGQQVSYCSDWIYDLEDEEHFLCYQRQASLVYAHCDRSDRLLEVGIGTGLLADLLRKRGWNISTLDIDIDKTPDFCADALSFDYQKENIDVVLAFEVFEHIPFATLKKLLSKLYRQGVGRIYFSVPWNKRRVFSAYVRIVGAIRLHLSLGLPIGKIRTRNHFWELYFRSKEFGEGQELVSFTRLREVFSENGFELTRHGKLGYIQFLSAQRIEERSVVHGYGPSG